MRQQFTIIMNNFGREIQQLKNEIVDNEVTIANLERKQISLRAKYKAQEHIANKLQSELQKVKDNNIDLLGKSEILSRNLENCNTEIDHLRAKIKELKKTTDEKFYHMQTKKDARINELVNDNQILFLGIIKIAMLFSQRMHIYGSNQINSNILGNDIICDINYLLDILKDIKSTILPYDTFYTDQREINAREVYSRRPTSTSNTFVVVNIIKEAISLFASSADNEVIRRNTLSYVSGRPYHLQRRQTIIAPFNSPMVDDVNAPNSAVDVKENQDSQIDQTDEKKSDLNDYINTTPVIDNEEILTQIEFAVADDNYQQTLGLIESTNVDETNDVTLHCNNGNNDTLVENANVNHNIINEDNEDDTTDEDEVQNIHLNQQYKKETENEVKENKEPDNDQQDNESDESISRKEDDESDIEILPRRRGRRRRLTLFYESDEAVEDNDANTDMSDQEPSDAEDIEQSETRSEDDESMNTQDRNFIDDDESSDGEWIPYKTDDKESSDEY